MKQLKQVLESQYISTSKKYKNIFNIENKYPIAPNKSNIIS